MKIVKYIATGIIALTLAISPLSSQSTSKKCDTNKVGEWEQLDLQTNTGFVISASGSTTYGGSGGFVEDYTLLDTGFVCGEVYRINYNNGVVRFHANVATLTEPTMWRTKQQAEAFVELGCKRVFINDYTPENLNVTPAINSNIHYTTNK